MEIKNNHYSLVILGNTHNPTVISETFFLKSGIIDKESDLDRNKLIITPALCQASIGGNTNIIVEPNTLNITSTVFEKPYDIAKKYCQNLGYIKSVAIGINFDFNVLEYDFDKLFNMINFTDFKGCTPNSISFVFNANDSTQSNVTLKRNDSKNANLRFNFHQPTPDVILGDLNMDFVNIAKEYYNQSNEFIKSLLK